MKPYDHKKIEKKWQKEWESKKVYKTLSAQEARGKNLEPYYVLDMFPYPSGSGLHVGHPRGYIASDVFARMKRMEGYNVLHPMGFDSFGLPAEQYAIQTGKNPGPFTNELVKRYREQLSILGFSYDWDRQVETHDPEYYKWTQWVFLQIYNAWYDEKENKARPISELVKIFEEADPNWKNLSEKEQQDVLMNYRLAYEGYATVNWCEEMGTVLANDEIVEKDGKMVSERGEYPVVKKQMRQWFMRITAYADRLLAGLETIDWPHSIKEIQKNWIGKSEGSEISFTISNSEKKITVFTTRADTLFGVTYVVLAPEHELVQSLKGEIKNWAAVEQYIKEVKSKSDEDRAAAKEKTGIVLEGVFAINPANNEQVPVWIADYVLASYGTGAVMAVPAHDERDFEFAKKYELPIKEVISIIAGDVLPDAKEVFGSTVIAYDATKKLFLKLNNHNTGETWLPSGGLNENETYEACALRELAEEGGIHHVQKTITLGSPITSYYFNVNKNSNRKSLGYNYLCYVDSGQTLDFGHEAHEHFSVEWVTYAELYNSVKGTRGGVHHWLMALEMANDYIAHEQDIVTTTYGLLINSGKFNELKSEEAKKAITEFVGGKLVTKYKMRDAIFARQRYWGEPIPLVHEKDGTVTAVPEKDLPLELPKVKSYAPAGDGQSPLATVSSWVKAGYETNTMPGWAGSSWYFLRYVDPKNKNKFADEAELDYWFGAKGGVDMYVGGAEHATGHLLYSRFWHKVLKDLGHVQPEEPFQKLRNQGMIGGTDGRKMSKRWGNVINPDDVVRDLGADTMRVYESFMGPFEAHLPWSTDGIVGSRRFIERVWKLQEKVLNGDPLLAGEGGSRREPGEVLQVQKSLHKTIKKVTDDIATFGFNTAVSAMMIFVNVVEKAESIATEDFAIFLKILAPFAPHVADELWELIDQKGTVHHAPWPTYDSNLIIEDSITMGIQVNGKVRAEIELGLDATEAEVKEKVMQMPEILKWTEGKMVKKFIFIPKKIISIVVE